jgi:hypothetical protein
MPTSHALAPEAIVFPVHETSAQQPQDRQPPSQPMKSTFCEFFGADWPKPDIAKG